MTPQQADFFTNWTAAVGAFLTAFADVEDRFTEAFDRGIDADLESIEFEGDLDHLTAANVGAAFAAYLAINATMTADDRAAWSDLLAVVRSWTR